jgi:hypothetical protein
MLFTVNSNALHVSGVIARHQELMLFIVNSNALHVSGVIARHQELMTAYAAYGTGELIYVVIVSYKL